MRKQMLRQHEQLVAVNKQRSCYEVTIVKACFTL